MKISLNILLPLLWIILTLISGASENIHLKLSTHECFPGDLVKLTATHTTPSYQDFTLSIPKNKNLSLIAKEVASVRLTNNQYSQTKTWIFQAIAPGSYQLSNITAKTSSRETLLKLPSLNLTVNSYDALDQDNTPAPFPSKTENPAKSIYYWFLLFLFIPLIIIIQKRKAEPQSQPLTPYNLNSLKQKLITGEIPENLCFQLLEQTPSSLSKTEIKLIEQALYQPSFTASDLLKSLNKEDKS